MPTKTQIKKLAPASVVTLSTESGCCKPCYISKHTVVNTVGGVHNPFHWIVDVAGYPIVDIVVQIRGTAGKYYQVQVRHHHPSSTVGPTATFVIASKSGNLGQAGFELLTFGGLRPLLPEVDIISFGNDDNDFQVVAATVYATVA